MQLRLHEPMLGALDTAAKAEGVGRVELIRRIVRDWLIAKGFLIASAKSGEPAEVE